MFQSIFSTIQMKIYSLWTFVSRKKRIMAETIRINVLVISAESENLTKRRIITLETTFDNTIDQLRPMIMEIRGKYSIQFDQYKRKEFYGCREMFPYELISKHFPISTF